RPLRDLFIDRRNLYAICGADEKRSGLGRSRHRRLVERRRRHGAEARTSRAVRAPSRHSLPAAGLERCHSLRLPRICHPQLEPMAARDRGHSLFARHGLSCLAAPALSQRHLAWFCVTCGKLPLFGSPRLLAVGISGLFSVPIGTSRRLAATRQLRCYWRHSGHVAKPCCRRNDANAPRPPTREKMAAGAIQAVAEETDAKM